MSSIEKICSVEKVDMRSSTHLSAKSIKYTWSISNFSLLSQFSKKKICSPNFDVVNTPFELRLRFDGEKGSDSEMFVVNLCKISKDGTSHYVKYKTRLLCSDSSCKRSERDHDSQEEELLFSDGRRLGRRMMFPIKDLKLPSKFILDDTLYIRCEITVLSEECQNNFRSAQTNKSLHKVMKSKQNNKDRLLATLLPLVMCIWLFIFTLDNSFANERLTEQKCKVYHNEVQRLIVDSTVKLNNIAEALNLTDIKEISHKIILSYAEMFNHTYFKATSDGLTTLNLSQVTKRF